MEINSISAQHAENLDRQRRHFELLLKDKGVMKVFGPQVIRSHQNIMGRIAVLTEPFLLTNVYPLMIRCLANDEYIE